MNKLIPIAAALVLLAAFPDGVRAESAEHAPDVSADGAAQFDMQREHILREMHDGGRYAEIAGQDRDEVLLALDEMAQLLAEYDSVEAMPNAQRLALFNAQEQLNTRLTLAAENSRVVCKREPKVGTNFRTNTCQTVAEWTLQREAAHAAVQRKQGGPLCSGAECSMSPLGPTIRRLPGGN